MDESQNNSKEDLEKILQDVKNSVTAIEQIRANAHEKVQTIETFYSQFEQLKGQIENGDTGLAKIFENANTIKGEIDLVKANSQVKLDEINSQANSVVEKVQTIETFYSQFEQLKGQIENGDTGLAKIFENANAIKGEIDLVKANSQVKLDEINSQANSVVEKVQTIETFYNEKFVKLRADIEDEKNGLQATLGAAQELKNQITKTKGGVDEAAKQVEKAKEETLAHKEESKKSSEKIEEFKNTSEEFKNQIEQTFKIATDVSLANSFNERKKELETETDKWLTHIKWSTIALTVLVIAIYFSQYIKNGDHPSDWKFWYRFAFTSPVIFYLAFVSHHYNKAKDLLEKYAFKFATSLSLQSYTKLLTDNFAEEKYKDELIKFSIGSIEMVYKEPYLEKDKTRKLSVGNKIINIGLEDIETLAKQDIDVLDIIKDKKITKEA